MSSLPQRSSSSDTAPVRATALKAISFSALLNAALMTLQIAIGLTAHSDGVLADGIHTLSDLAADSIILIVLYLATKTKNQTATPRRDSAQHEAIASLFIAALLILTAAEMLWHSIGQTATLTTSTAMQAIALAIALIVTIAKESLFRYMRAESQRTHSAILLASAWHARVDAVSALVATLGIAGGMAGLPMLDHLAGAAIGLMILRMGLSAGWSAFKNLLGRPLGTTADDPTISVAAQSMNQP